MKKIRTKFVCQSCGHDSPRWMGKCPDCGEWNSSVEERSMLSKSQKTMIPNSATDPTPLAKIPLGAEDRLCTGIDEFDRVLGGGIVSGSVYLVAGAPGMGKSTLLLQAGAGLCQAGKNVLYVTGEESLNQVKLRAHRLNIESDRFYLLAETRLDMIIGCIEAQQPDMIVVDSIQTVSNSEYPMG